MSVSDLNHFMTYVIEGWMLFSAGFISTTFVSFVSRRIQEDLEAAALAEGQVIGQLAPAVTEEVNITEAEEVSVTEAVEAATAQVVSAPEPLQAAPMQPPSEPKPSKPTPPAPKPPATTPSGRENDEAFAADEPTAEENAEALERDKTEAARLEEVAAVSEQLAKNRGKQSDSSSVSVST